MKQLFLAVTLMCSALATSANSLAMDVPKGKNRFECAGPNKNVSIEWNDAGMVKVRYYEDGKFKEENALMFNSLKNGVFNLKSPDYSRQVQYDVKQKRATLKGYAPLEMTCSLLS